MVDRIRIVSDGTCRGTKVLLPNGERHPGAIAKIEWSIDAKDGLGTAVLTFVNVAVEVEADVAQSAAPREIDTLRSQLPAIALAAVQNGTTSRNSP